MNSFVCGFLFALSAACFAQRARQVPAVDVSSPVRALKTKANDICAVDFRNTRVFGEAGDDTAKLKDGLYERKWRSGVGSERVSLDYSFCIKQSDRAKHALVILDWLDCGGSCSRTGVVQVLTIKDHHPVIKQQFVFDSHAEGTGASFDEKSLVLTVTGRSDDGSPNCCAEFFDVVTYAWAGSRFEQQGFTRVSAPPPRRIEDEMPQTVR